MNVQSIHEGNAEQTLAYADAFQLLSLFLNLPTTELAAGLLDGSLQEDVVQLAKELSVPEKNIAPINALLDEVKNSPLDANELRSALRVEYTRLFVHPLRARIFPYEALFLFDPAKPRHQRPVLFTNGAALDAERLYRQCGLERNPEQNDSGDRFSTQLEFASFLLRQRLSLSEEGAEASEENSKILEEFYTLHLKRWMTPFFTKLIAEAEDASYKAMGLFGLLISEQ